MLMHYNLSFLLMKNIKNISNIFFLSNFSKFVILQSSNLIYYNFIYFISHVIPKFLFSIVVNKYSYNLIVSEKYLYLILRFLKKHYQAQFRTLVDIAAIDLYSRNFRFQINYILLSMFFSTRIICSTYLTSFQNVTSIIKLFKSANWMEREIWDLFGIWIKNHYDLRRILTDYNFYGHPLRKDFPLTGFYEIYYDEYYKSLITLRLSLQQNFRSYSIKSTWV